MLRCPHTLRRVIERSLPEQSRGRFYFFNSFFYKKLTEKLPASAPQEGPSPGAGLATLLRPNLCRWPRLHQYPVMDLQASQES